MFKMVKKNILFVCKYNIFRSKVAEAYSKKVSANINVKSAGLIAEGIPLYENEKRILKENDLILSKTSTCLSKPLLDWADTIVIIANDIPKKVLMRKDSKRDIRVWKIRDSFAGASDRTVQKIITAITSRMNRTFGDIK